MESNSISRFVDLHRHHDTSLTPESISRVAKLLHIGEFENKTIDQIKLQVQAPDGSNWDQWYQYLNEARKSFVSVTSVAELTRDVIKNAAKEGLTILELRISLLSTVDKIREYNASENKANYWDVSRRTLEAILTVRDQETQNTDMGIDLILSISCQKKYRERVSSYVDLMKDYASKIIAVDLTNELETEPSFYKADLKRIRPYIPFLTIHCMETTKPERGWDALKLDPDRLGHGINSVQDPELVQEIRRRNIVLEICPLSNILTGVTNAQNHPFRKLDEAGVKITINHDGLNNATSLNDDYIFVQKTFGYREEDLLRFVQNGLDNAFRNIRKKTLH
jgi:adenosine deaminase